MKLKSTSQPIEPNLVVVTISYHKQEDKALHQYAIVVTLTMLWCLINCHIIIIIIITPAARV